MNNLVLLILLMTSASSLAADYVIKWGINVEPIVYFSKASKEFKKRVEARTNGKISVELYENTVSQEGHNHLADVKNNTFQMSQETVFQLQKIIPEFAIWNLPYLFENDEHVIRYTKSSHGLGLLKKLESEGVVGIDYTYSGGFLYLVGEGVAGFEQLGNLTVGLEESSKEYNDFFSKNLKSNVKEVDFGRLVYDKSGMNVSEIIGSTAREILPFAKQKKLFMIKSNHRVISRVLFLSKNFLDSLPSDLKKIVMEEARFVAAYERDLSIQDKIALDKDMIKAKVKIVNWDKNKLKAQRKIFGPLYSQYIEKYGQGPISSVLELSK